jgi:hypothetical protein
MSYFHFGCRFAFLKKLSFGMYDFLFSFYDWLVNLRVLRKIYKALQFQRCNEYIISSTVSYYKWTIK